MNHDNLSFKIRLAIIFNMKILIRNAPKLSGKKYPHRPSGEAERVCVGGGGRREGHFSLCPAEWGSKLSYTTGNLSSVKVWLKVSPKRGYKLANIQAIFT